MIFIILALASSCFTSIAKINKNPHKYDSKKVRVKGRVISSTALDDLNIFYLQNNKHNIAVITEGYLPIKNEIIIVKGTVIEKFKYRPKSEILVIHEKIKIKDKKYKAPKYKYLDKKHFRNK